MVIEQSCDDGSNPWDKVCGMADLVREAFEGK
jgi:hypothetical protein